MLSFMTAQAPTLLLYLNFSSQNFLAILLSWNGECWWHKATRPTMPKGTAYVVLQYPAETHIWTASP